MHATSANNQEKNAQNRVDEHSNNDAITKESQVNKYTGLVTKEDKELRELYEGSFQKDMPSEMQQQQTIERQLEDIEREIY